ncbi:histidinol-phosphate transaminase [Planosporangium thailandense]|uniref:Histidinol-phosphate transaminase n=1 Tax=Planosporangium thailandense TaxID=765197 RepID=A0ABX0Y938_9ACTN|nr:histidinol-phosphate transaminase [Planosporangium thailandense]
MTGGNVRHRLALNESPYPPLPSVREAMLRAVSEANRYPEFYPDRLAERIAHWCGVAPASVAVGSGSVGVALQLLHAVVRPADRVAFGWRNFDAYPLLADMVGAEAVPVPLTADGRQDLAGLAAAIDGRTRVVVVCNPHNPTGSLVTATELTAFLDHGPAQVTVVLDEAYVEFARGDDLPDARTLLGAYPNLAVLRTFSKAYGLAGLRVGYALAAPALADRIRRQQLPFGISGVAAAAVEASMSAGDELRDRVDAVIAERERLRDALLGRGWRVLPSHTNCLWLAEPDRVADCEAALTAAGVQARYYPGEGVRLTVGDRRAGDAVLAALGGCPAQPRGCPETVASRPVGAGRDTGRPWLNSMPSSCSRP